MDVENESVYHSSSPSSTSSQNHSSSTQEKTPLSSRKRKAGRKKFKETRHPVYRGVRQRNGNKWVCEVREPNKKSRIWLGTYPTPEMAARAHDVAALALRGNSAVLNFPYSVSLLPLAKSSSAAHIREAASKVSKVFGPTTSPSSSANPCCEEGESQERVEGGDDLVMTQDNKVIDHESKPVFFDEEALYNMPGLLDSMAEGLLITPPSMKRAFDWDDVDCETDLPLWTD
ncbi:dehydration-responsive element-binding protein 1F-like [Abrus precatorius]|uniref:Dehydration-responsive element-binding protein 1F-like n=1 Tax=Abrus precatorius TaxID=3816 RepID=A0A8B8KJC5_ABRPR|nr:dehydration-responsive element-binding protein 1F-like [Abrus precatorius]